MNKRLKELAEQAGLFWQFSPAYEKCLEHFAELVRQDEREACAKLCDDLDRKWNQSGVRECAKAIRARNNE